MTPAPAPTPDREPESSPWGLWAAWTWVAILLLCALATAVEWDDLALALDLVRNLR